MVLPQHLSDKGFSLSDVYETDFSDYFVIHKACMEKYVDEYFGGWVDEVQRKMSTDEFRAARSRSEFQKIVLDGKPVGFFSFDEMDDEIDGIYIQIIDKARNMGIGSFFLEHITTLSNNSGKPIILKVFKSNPAQNLYGRFGFKIYDETFSHYLMRYTSAL